MEEVLLFFVTAGDKWKKVECQMKIWKRNDLLHANFLFTNEQAQQLIIKLSQGVLLPPLV